MARTCGLIASFRSFDSGNGLLPSGQSGQSWTSVTAIVLRRCPGGQPQRGTRDGTRVTNISCNTSTSTGMRVRPKNKSTQQDSRSEPGSLCNGRATPKGGSRTNAGRSLLRCLAGSGAHEPQTLRPRIQRQGTACSSLGVAKLDSAESCAAPFVRSGERQGLRGRGITSNAAAHPYPFIVIAELLAEQCTTERVSSARSPAPVLTTTESDPYSPPASTATPPPATPTSSSSRPTGAASIPLMPRSLPPQNNALRKTKIHPCAVARSWLPQPSTASLDPAAVRKR